LARPKPFFASEKRPRDEAGRCAFVSLYDIEAEKLLPIQAATVKTKGNHHCHRRRLCTITGKKHRHGGAARNTFEVVNMGVMVLCHEILARAKVEGADRV
jgi:hypothetical protein